MSIDDFNDVPEEQDIEINLDPVETDETESELNLDFGAGEEATDDVEINLNFGDFADEDVNPETGEIDLGVEADEAADEDDAPADADEAVEKALEELRAELRTQVGDWYVVHTYSGMENRVKQNIEARVTTLNMEDYIFEVIVPTEDAVEMRNGQKKNVTRTFMPGYVLVRMDLTDESWATVRHTPSVTGLVGQANQPVPLSMAEVERMLTPSIVAKVNAESTSTPKRPRKVEVTDYAVGDSVMVVDGPFAGIHATITEININNQRVKANVEILGRETPVDLTFPQIQKVI